MRLPKRWRQFGTSRLQSCCHDLRPIAQAIYYSTTPIELNSIEQLFKFLRTMLDQPYLAGRVKDLKLRFGRWPSPGWQLYTQRATSISKTYDNKMRKDVAYTVNSFRQDIGLNQYWVHRYLPEGEFHSVVAFALIILRGLQKLTLELDCRESSGHQFSKENLHTFNYIHHVLHEAVRRELSEHSQEEENQESEDDDIPQRGRDYSRRILRSLSFVCIRLFINGPSSDSMHHLARFSRLKSVKRLVVTWINPRGLDILKPSRVGTNITGIQCLYLQIPAPFETAFFRDFMSCFLSLRTFSLWGSQIRDRGSLPENDYLLSSIVRSIGHLKPDLVKLTLAVRCRANYEARMTGTSHIESLTGFRQLTNIDVVAFDLWVSTRAPVFNNRSSFGRLRHIAFRNIRLDITPLISILPASIKTLRLQEGGLETIVHVRDFLEADRNRTPDLKAVDIITRGDIDIGDYGPEIAFLEHLATNRGITLTVMTRYQAGLEKL